MIVHKPAVFIKPVGGFPAHIGADFQLGTARRPCCGFHCRHQSHPRTGTPCLLPDNQLLELPHWGRVVEQLLDVEAGKS